MNTIDLNNISSSFKICSARKSDSCIKVGPKEQFNKGRWCKNCMNKISKEY